MPELPEVETVVRTLRPQLVGRTITSVRQSKFQLRRPWKPAWNAQVKGARVEAVRRRGKWILIDITNPPPGPLPSGRGRKTTAARGVAWETGNVTRQAANLTDSNSPSLQGGGRGVGCLRIHLGMTGQFTVVPASAPVIAHTHVVFTLDDGNELRFRDPRRFGAVEFFRDRAKLEADMNAELGPEPFGLNALYFRAALQASARNLKALLLDQGTVAGVGNIYADEACFRAKLHPGRRGASLSDDECDRLREAIEAILTNAIANRGTSFDKNYVGGDHEPAAYGRTGEPCAVCATAIVCERFAGRSTHYCPQCQKLKSVPQRHKDHTKKHKEKKPTRAAS